jgi:sulfopyruvate decarboxylase subunit alpha
VSATATSLLSASAAVAALQRNGVDHVVTVPDWVQLSLHARLHRGVPGIRLINATNENQCITVAAGLTIGGRKPVLVMQNQGLYNAINTLRAVCLDAHVPLVFLVGQFGREYANIGQDPRRSRRTMVRIMEPLLDSIGVPFMRVERDADFGAVDQAYARAQRDHGAVVLLVGGPVAWQ